MFDIQATFTAAEAATIARFFYRLSEQIELASKQGRFEDVASLCTLNGRMQIRIFGFEAVNTPFDAPDDEATGEQGPVCEFCEQGFTEDNPNMGTHRDYHAGCGNPTRDTDEAYERMVEEEMGCD
jgi:hypothetical protein